MIINRYTVHNFGYILYRNNYTYHKIGINRAKRSLRRGRKIETVITVVDPDHQRERSEKKEEKGEGEQKKRKDVPKNFCHPLLVEMEEKGRVVAACT